MAIVINLDEVGVHAGAAGVRFGVYLPGVKAADGFAVDVRIIHLDDQFVPEIPSIPVPLTFDPTHPLGLWSVSVDLTALPRPPGSHLGNPGGYLYRFQLRRGGAVITSVFLDPFAVENGPGLLGAFTLGPVPAFPWTDAAHRTPPLDELIVYELNVAEFYGTFDGAVARLDYLEALGVNCLSLMPITPVKHEFDWGYGPLGYFAPEDYLGGRDGLKRLVDAAHARGVAVVLDVVYGHAAASFAYGQVYDDIRRLTGLTIPTPMMQDPNRDGFGRGFDHDLALTRAYCLEANKYFLGEYHVDGFRYDNVPGFYDDNPLTKYGTLAFDTYRASQAIPRFADPGNFSRVIQIAEHLPDPRGILRRTFSSSAWQDDLLCKVRDMAAKGYVDDAFAHLLDPGFGPDRYPDTHDGAPAGDQPFPVAPLQYLNSHDHSWLITSFGLESTDIPGDIRFGDRRRDFKLQPFAIALLASRGVPMLWEGEEFGENYALADRGALRISFLRGMHWEYFYDDDGNYLVKVYRRMGKLRRALPALRSRDFFYFNTQSRPGDGLIAFQRRAPASQGQPQQIALVLLNFSDQDHTLTIAAPVAGTYREMLDRLHRGGAELDFGASAPGAPLRVTVPSNYGRVLVTPPPPPGV